MKLLWSQRAERDLVAIGRYVARDRPAAARRWVERLRRRAREAVDHPLLGRAPPENPRPDLRELVEGRYRIVYRVSERAIEVVTVFEGHRRPPAEVAGDEG